MPGEASLIVLFRGCPILDFIHLIVQLWRDLQFDLCATWEGLPLCAFVPVLVVDVDTLQEGVLVTSLPIVRYAA